jgi:hypothetical protein
MLAVAADAMPLSGKVIDGRTAEAEAVSASKIGMTNALLPMLDILPTVSLSGAE